MVSWQGTGPCYTIVELRSGACHSAIGSQGELGGVPFFDPAARWEMQGCFPIENLTRVEAANSNLALGYMNYWNQPIRYDQPHRQYLALAMLSVAAEETVPECVHPRGVPACLSRVAIVEYSGNYDELF